MIEPIKKSVTFSVSFVSKASKTQCHQLNQLSLYQLTLDVKEHKTPSLSYTHTHTCAHTIQTFSLKLFLGYTRLCQADTN